MTRPLSHDLRVRLVGCVAAGLSCRAAADRYGVAASTAVKWVRRWRDTGVGAPRPQRRARRLHQDGAALWALAARQALHGRDPAWPLEDDDFRRRAEAHRH